MTGDASDQRLSSWSKLLSREAYSVFRCFRCAVCSACVCVCVWAMANRCDQSATVDNWEAQASAVVEVHRVLLIIVIVVVVTMVVHVSRWPDQRTQSVLTVSLSLFSVFFLFPLFTYCPVPLPRSSVFYSGRRRICLRWQTHHMRKYNRRRSIIVISYISLLSLCVLQIRSVIAPAEIKAILYSAFRLHCSVLNKDMFSYCSAQYHTD